MLHAIASVYGRDLTSAVVELYWNALRELDIGAVRQALDRHVKNPDTGMFMPKPADIHKMLGGTTTDSAMQAWSKVERAIRLTGSYRDQAFDDALIHRVVADMGGWIALCDCLTENMPFRANEFTARYRGLVMRRETPEHPPLLTGRVNLHNAAKGFDLEPPALIGDQDKALRIAHGGADEAGNGVDRVRLGSTAGAQRLAGPLLRSGLHPTVVERVRGNGRQQGESSAEQEIEGGR